MKKITTIYYLFFLLTVQSADAQIPVLYGMTSEGGKYGNGTIIKINGNGANFDTVYSFPLNKRSGYNPTGSLLKDTNDLLYGMTQYGGSTDFGVIFSFDPTTNIYIDLHNFNDTDGAYPRGNLIEASDGKFYGVTFAGGLPNFNFGVIFSFDPKTDTFKNLHTFISPDGVTDTNGINPAGSLLQDGNNLYGITSGGGDHTYGVIFSYNISSGTFSKLHDFNLSQGSISFGSLVKANNNNLYGMTSSGGKNSDGVIFSFNISNNSYSDVHDFAGSGNGNAPQGSLINATDDNLYGMTEMGDNNTGINGILFSFNPTGNSFNPLYEFSGITGSSPQGSLVQGSDGNLYGMTLTGGDSSYGNIFRFDLTNNSFKNLVSFNNTLGAVPYGDLIQVGTDTGSGINQLSVINNQLSVYPNPSIGAINISSSKNIDNLLVTNLLGQVIYITQPKQTHFDFDITESGMYFITITSDNQVETRKIVVSR